MNTNVVLARTFTKALKETAANFSGEFADLVTSTLSGAAVSEKMAELASLIETNRQIAALRDQKRLLVAASRPAVQLDENGNPVKRGRGRPRKNPLPAPSTTPAPVKAAKKSKVVIPDTTDEA